MASITSMPERTTDREREGGGGERESALRHSDASESQREREFFWFGAFRFEFENWGGTWFSPLQKYLSRDIDIKVRRLNQQTGGANNGVFY